MFWVCSFPECVIDLIGNCCCVQSWIRKQEVVREAANKAEVSSRWMEGIWSDLVRVVTTTEWGELETEHDTSETSNYTHTEEEEEDQRKETDRTFIVGSFLFLRLPAVMISQLDDASITQRSVFPSSFVSKNTFQDLNRQRWSVTQLQSCQPAVCQRPHLFKTGSWSNFSCSVMCTAGITEKMSSWHGKLFVSKPQRTERRRAE